MSANKRTFSQSEKESLDEFICEYVDVCKENGLPYAKKKGKAVLAYLENPFDPLLLEEIDVLLCWDALSLMDRNDFLETLLGHFTFLLRRQVMLD